MKRQLSLIALAAFAAIGLVGFWLNQPTDPINAANFELLEIGMEERQVDEILGGSASGEIQLELQGSIKGMKLINEPRIWRSSGSRAIIVYFQHKDGKHTVSSKEFFNPGLSERIKAWWGGYELAPFPFGGKSKRLETAA